MPTLVVIAGLPGSGKTTLIEEMRQANAALGLVVGDYMKDSLGNSRCLKDSRHHQALIARLGEGKDCVIADVQFVRREKREELVSVIRGAVPTVAFRWICFENDWLQCLKNVDHRAGTDPDKFERDATGVVQLTRRYSIPDGAEIRPVWKGP